MRTLLVGIGIVTLAACDADPKPKKEAGPPGAATLDELRDRALAAIRADDANAYLDLMGSPAFLARHCAAEPEYSALDEGGAVAGRAEQKIEVRAAVAACAHELDWAKATVERVEGGAPRSASSLQCDPPSQELADLVAVV